MLDLENCTNNISDTHFLIQDDIENQPAYIKYDQGQFEVKNNTKKDIGFLQIDDCIYTSKDKSRCDCAVYDDKVFCFIELKTCKILSQKANRKKADAQLRFTIEQFRSDGIIHDQTLEAYACLTCNYDGKFTKITNARNQNTIVEFEDELNTRLYYECKKEFNK